MKLTDLNTLFTASLNNLLYIIDTNDTGSFLSGSSKKITVGNLLSSSGVIGGGGGGGTTLVTGSTYPITSSWSINAITASYVTASIGRINNITASNISASGYISASNFVGNTATFNNITSSGPIYVSGSNAYLQLLPVNNISLPSNLTASYIYTSGSTNDMYFTQYNGPYTNTTRLRWLESNLYTGILNGGVLTSTPGSTTFTVTAGEGIIVSMNAFTASAPYPTVKFVNWPTSTQPIINSGSAKITYVGLDDLGQIVQQTNAWGSSDINQWDNQIELGVVLHLSGSVSNGVFNSPQISYGIPQQTDDFLRAFGPLKISGHTLQASGSTPTLSIKKSGGTAYRDGANYVNNPNHPSTVVENAITSSKIYRYYISGSTPIIDTGVGNAGYTTIDNDNYVNTATGQLVTVGNSNWTIQRVFWIPNSPTNAFIVYYGNATYSTLLNAVNAKDSEPFTESPNTSLNAIFVGYIIIEGGAGRDLLNALECTIIQGGLFRNVGGIGSSGTAPVSTTLAGLSDVALAGLTEGDLLVYGGGQWNNKKTLIGNYIVSGSLNVTSGITGNLTGTSSWTTNAITSSYSLSSSNSITSSFISPLFISQSAVSYGFGSGGGSGAGFPFTGSANISGSLNLSGSQTITNNLTVNGYISASSFTGSLFGSSSFSISSSYALTASYALNGGSGGGNLYLVNTSSLITATLTSSTQQFVSNGVQNFYNLNEISKSATDILVFVNGVAQRPTSSYNVISESILVFNPVPASGSNVEIRYFSSALLVSFATSSLGAEYYTGNNSASLFLLTNQYVYHDYDVVVSLDGLIQKPTIDYTVISGSYLSFSTPPPQNTDIEVRYLVVTTTAISAATKAAPPSIVYSQEIDWGTNDNFEKQASTSETYTFTNVFPGRSMVFILSNTGSIGTIVPTFSASIKWSSGISPEGTFTGSVSVYTFYKTNYYLLGNAVENYI
jgi:hypothetical protein